MKVKFKYTITAIRDDDTDNWEGVNTPEELLKSIAEYCKEDVSYIMDTLFAKSGDTVNIEVIE